MLFAKCMKAQRWKRLGRNRSRQDSQQSRQQENAACERENTDDLKFRIGGRSRSIPVIQRFNQWIRKRKGDQAYENDDLESLARHN